MEIFSEIADYEFNHWNFSGTTQEEFDYLMDIFKNIEKEVYIADYEELGVNSCRILVPGYSEIYEADDLIWDNHNKSLDFRTDILNLHQLNDDELVGLIENLKKVNSMIMCLSVN